MDDGTLGGSPDIALNDLITVIDKSTRLGLELNFSKCEMEEMHSFFNQITPGIILKSNYWVLL